MTMQKTVLVLFAVGCGGSNVAQLPAIPDALKPPAGQSLAVQAQATGAQVYECKPGKDDPAKLEWALKGPDAELFDVTGKKIGKHYAGPTWEGEDGSKVVGEVKAKDPGPDAGAIPWLLMSAKSAEGGGMFGQIATIQRVRTEGGKAPAGACTLGAEARVPYKAMYLFYK
jgi:hypothetical protein